MEIFYAKLSSIQNLTTYPKTLDTKGKFDKGL